MKRKSRFLQKGHKRVSEFLLLGAIFFVPAEMAVDLPLGFLSPYKVFIALFIIHFIWMFSEDREGNSRRIRGAIKKGVGEIKYIAFFLAAYIIYDLISLIWTEDRLFSLKKYATILPMILILLMAMVVYFIDDYPEEKMEGFFLRLMTSLGLMAFVLSFITILSFLVHKRTYYILRLSLQRDYNQFASSILLGYICFFYPLFKGEFKRKRQALMIFFYNLIVLPVLYLSGSRRIIVVLPLVLLFLLILTFMERKSPEKRPRKEERLIKFLPLISFILSIILSFFICRAYEAAAENIYKDMELNHSLNTGKYSSPFRREQGLEYKRETIKNGQAMEAREAIWKVAKEEIENFSTRDLIFGKGGSFHRDCYRNKKHFKTLYPHGIPEGDLLYSHPHSFILTAIMDQGLIGLFLSLGLVFSCIYYLIQLFKKEDYTAFICLFLYGACQISFQAIDSIMGIQQNRLTLIYVILFLLANKRSRPRKLEDSAYIEFGGLN